MITFLVPGEPKAKKRHVMRKTGYAYTPTETVEYENWVKLCFMESECRMLEGELKAEITAFFTIPKSVSKKKRSQMMMGDIRPTKKPDTDNIAKAILDSLNGIAYKDDSQVVELVVRKVYAEQPRVVVQIWGTEELGGEWYG